MSGYETRLLATFEQLAANRKVVQTAFGVNSGGQLKTLGRFAQRMGYAKVGENYVK
jgi:hypothetical protein